MGHRDACAVVVVMTDAELELFLGIAHAKGRAVIMGSITMEERALYDEMARVEAEVALYVEGMGPKPKGVIICGCGRRGRHRHGRGGR